MQKIVPYLWFDGKAEEAAAFYTSIFPDSVILKTSYYDEPSAEVSGRKKGDVLVVEFELTGYKMAILNGGPNFQLNPSISFFVNCETPEEIDVLWEKFSKGGKALMALDKYPFSEKYGWIQDKYGVSWQLILAKNPQKIVPSFLFVGDQYGKAKEAIDLYISLFPDSSIIATNAYPAGQGEKEGALSYASFTLAGQQFAAMDSGIDHQFSFSEAISLEVNCDTQEEVDHYWNAFTKRGAESMCGWLKDEFGISWQIVPRILNELLTDPDKKKAENTMKAMLEMRKLDIAELQAAYNQE